MAIHGKDTVFSLDGQDISEHLTNVSFPRQQDTHDSTTFGQTGHTFIGGLTNGTFSLQGFWDKTAVSGSATVLDGLIVEGTPVAWEYGPEGGTTGDIKYSGNGIVQSVDYASPVADLVTFAATIQISGAVTTGTYA